ncbi:AAA domain-containing protein [Acetobacterium fimetarium]|uniref:AAA domain-containing protein n=1 Tax=Acetobacterium fimetarium TaxID=52691 RepID=A0ABR6WXE4_9FIRM|nr:AAA family ATPase [Acetobacterium fimetarium]MBC3804916.1 AAA domain-containing protein [Acetobacterium fimetarium]
METNQYDWVNFYKEFSHLLLDYKSNRQELIDKVKSSYSDAGINLPTLEKDNLIVDMDPFTVFGLFNKSSMKESNRVKIISALAEKFGVRTDTPTSFDSIPVLNNQNATFYYFVGERAEHDIDELWNLFEAALAYSDNPSRENREVLSKYFDLAINKKGNGNSKITMALYWIAPNSFLNLDQRNTWYIYESGKVPAAVVASLPATETKIKADKYFDIVEKLRSFLSSSESSLKDFKEMSFEAWRYSEAVNQEKKTKKTKASNAAFLKWFKPVIQALRDLGGSATPQVTRNKIIENEHLAKAEINETRGKSNVNKFENEVAFARNYLVYGGYVDNSTYGIWRLTDEGWKVDMTESLAAEVFKKGVKANRDDKGDGLADEDVDTVHYWIYSPGDGAIKWEDFYRENIMGIGWSEIGDLTQYASKDDMKAAMKEKIDSSKPYKNAAHATWQFVHDLKPGDIVFVKKGMHQLVGRGVVASDYFFDSSIDVKYSNLRKMNWTDNCLEQPKDHPGQAVMKTLTDITSYTDYVEKLCVLFDTDQNVDDDEMPEVSYPFYGIVKFLDEVYMDEASYNTLVGLIRTKKNVILQGAPGVGKTYAAKRLAYSMMGVKNQERVMMIQFHQSYSYEDFIEGFRPSAAGDGFEIKKGSFYNFCKKAAEDLEHEYFFIIDEINRGNLSKIFGELFMLIENDKRGNALQLLYSDEKFFVPKNICIIGMMNTADRSLAMLDYALRRRFAFYEMQPGFESDGFREYRLALKSQKFDNLINCVENLNGVITVDESLGEGFCIGHSYFCGLAEITHSVLSNIVEYELIPLLKEYWFDEPQKIKEWANYLRSAIK